VNLGSTKIMVGFDSDDKFLSSTPPPNFPNFVNAPNLIFINVNGQEC